MIIKYKLLKDYPRRGCVYEDNAYVFYNIKYHLIYMKFEYYPNITRMYLICA